MIFAYFIISYFMFYRSQKIIPPYMHRAGYIPREVVDFGDGGAFPEIHLTQFPLNMGKPGKLSKRITRLRYRKESSVIVYKNEIKQPNICL